MTHLTLFLPGLLYPLRFLLPNARHIPQALWMLFDDIQRLDAKMMYQQFGCFRTNTLDKPTAQVFLHAGGSCRFFYQETGDAQLRTILLVRFPRTPYF